MLQWLSLRRSCVQFVRVIISAILILATLMTCPLIASAAQFSSKTIMADYFELEDYLYMLARQHPVLVSTVIMFIIAILISLTVLLASAVSRQRLLEFEQQKTKEMTLLAKQAQEANASKSRFLFNMSHDIRTPMNAIIGFTDLVLKESDVPAQVRDNLEKIRTSSNYLLAIINDVQEMSRIENSKIELTKEPCNISKIAAEVETIIRVTAEEKYQTFTVDLSGVQNPNVLCDSLRLKEILTNLLSNAVKFTPEHGCFSLNITEKLSESFGTANYEICVKDNGIGMSREFLQKVFLPFERERSSTVSGIPGTGLGLSITKRFVELMSGTIQVKSEEHHGTEFIVELPLKQNTQAEKPSLPQESMDTAALDFTGKRLLLVEDNELNREIEATVLTEAGFIVDEAEDGAIAVEKVQHSPAGFYAVILMDIQMPVMDGYVATRAIRSLENKELENTPIIAVSANAYDEDVRSSLAAGMNGHIAKPITAEKLLAAIEKAMKNRA